MTLREFGISTDANLFRSFFTFINDSAVLYYYYCNYIHISVLITEFLLPTVTRYADNSPIMGWRLLSARDSHVGSLTKTFFCLGLHTA